MFTFPKRLRGIRPTLAAASLCMLVLTGCGDVARLLSPGGSAKGEVGSGPARVAITASLSVAPAHRAGDVVLALATFYQRRSGTLVPIGTQRLPLTDAATQAVPVTLDIAACLVDADRAVLAGSDASCPAVISLSLLVDGVEVDAQTIGPLSLRAGATTDVPAPVTLFEIQSVQISAASGASAGATGEITGILGTPATLAARILDTRGGVVAGRPAEWSSSDPTVATVDAATGVVTTVSVGVAQIDVRVGSVRSSVAFRVQRAPAQLTVTAGTGSGLGTVRSTPAGIDCRVTSASATGICSYQFSGDAVVSLTATPDAGSAFGDFGTLCTAPSGGATCALTLSAARTGTVRFQALRRITVSGMGDGSGRLTAAGGLDCRIDGGRSSGTCTADLPDGAALTLTAQAVVASGVGSSFGGFSGDCGATTGPMCTLTASGSNLAVAARFSTDKSLRLILGGGGMGTVTATGGIACAITNGQTSGNCEATYANGASVTLTAAPGAQTVFAGWTGACEGAPSTSCVVTVDQSRTISAIFDRQAIPLTITLGGSGGGSVIVNGNVVCARAAGSAAVDTCVQQIPIGTFVTITGQAATGSDFGGLSGGCSGQTCTLAMVEARTVSATFTAVEVPITVTLRGPGSGRVRVNAVSCTLPAGADAVSCTAMVALNAEVIVEALSDAGSTFDGYSGACNGIACRFIATSPASITAKFSSLQVPVTVTVGGGGSGQLRIGSSTTPCVITGSSAPFVCMRLVDIGVPVTITASPSIGTAFSGFAAGAGVGPSCGVAPTCEVTPLTAISLGATFVMQQVRLTVTAKAGATGSGSVQGNGISCSVQSASAGGSCTALVPYGSVVSLTAAPSTNSANASWTGPCDDLLAAVCTFNATANSTISAEFLAALSATISLSGNGNGAIRIDVPGTPAQAACDYRSGVASECSFAVPFGRTGTIRGLPAAGSSFGGFSGSCDQGGAGPYTECTFRAVGFSRQLSASFTRP